VTPLVVDSSVLIDIVGTPGPWTAWSTDALRRAADEHVLVINPVIYAEVSMGFGTIEALDEALPEAFYRREDVPYPAAFLAGRCFLDYRRRGGTRTGVLPDFLIGAHAAVAGYGLLTRDATRVRTYFPRLRVIAPA
jgi:predicted nucleic acid-binding protein